MQEVAVALDEFHSASAVPDPDSGVTADEVSALLDQIEDFFGLGRLKGLGAQYQQGDFFERVRNATRSFLKECATASTSWRLALNRYRGDGQVPLMTITKSKGLEYDVVVLLGLDDSDWWSFQKNPDEGHSTFFVAASRARERLFMTLCKGQRTAKIGEIYTLLDAAGVKTINSDNLVSVQKYPHNQYQTRLREISARMSQTDAHLRYSLIEHLLAERIVAWGCRETPTAPSMAIPGPAWNYIYISSFRNCIATEKTRAKTQIFNLRIFPIVESADVIDRLSDKTFMEALQMCLVNDPQLGAARKRAIASGGTPASFANEWHPYRAVWPVVPGEGSDIEPKSDDPAPDNLAKAADRIQGQRLAKLIGYLSSGVS